MVAFGLAGCSGGKTDVEGEGGTSLAAPTVDTQDGVWEQADSGKVTRQIDNVGTAEGKTITYTHLPSLDQVKGKTRGKFNQAVGIGFAARFQLDGVLISNIPLRVMMGDISDSFKSRLQGRDIQDIEETDAPVSNLSPPDTDNVNATGFRGRYSTGPFEMEVEMQGGETRTFKFRDEQLPIQALLAVWKKNGELYASGGAWPAERYMQRTRWVNVTGDGVGDGADARVRVTLPFMRNEIRTDVVELVESTQ